MSLRTLTAAAALLAASAAAAQSFDAPRFNQVDLQVEVVREVPNDLMHASLVAEANDPSAARVADELNRAMAEALKAAGEFKAVKTRSGFTQTFPVYDRANKLTGWRGRSELRLESKDAQAMAALIGKLQPALQLAGVSFSVSPEVRRQTEDELLVEAVAAFRARAEIAAKAIGGRSYKIRRIGLNAGGFQPGPRPLAMARSAAAVAEAAAPPVFEAGTSTVQVVASGTVEVE